MQNIKRDVLENYNTYYLLKRKNTMSKKTILKMSKSRRQLRFEVRKMFIPVAYVF